MECVVQGIIETQATSFPFVLVANRSLLHSQSIFLFIDFLLDFPSRRIFPLRITKFVYVEMYLTLFRRILIGHWTWVLTGVGSALVIISELWFEVFLVCVVSSMTIICCFLPLLMEVTFSLSDSFLDSGEKFYALDFYWLSVVWLCSTLRRLRYFFKVFAAFLENDWGSMKYA